MSGFVEVLSTKIKNVGDNRLYFIVMFHQQAAVTIMASYTKRRWQSELPAAISTSSTILLRHL